jgi:outer membrane receptor protein involved in Fe transport
MITVAVAAAATLAGQAGAQEATLEEVMVTARKKTENLQHTPLDIAAITSERIRQFNISDTTDVARHTPALTFDVGVLPNDTRPVIRGVSTVRGRPNVAVLVDFVDVSSESLTVFGGGMTANLRLLDLERIEVVKGPSTALYGRSAFSGAVNYITKRPGDEFSAEVSADIDEHNTADLRLMLTGPLTDKLGARLNLVSYQTDGWYENPNTGGELGNADNVGAALALQWQATENFSAYLRAEYSDEEYSPRAQAFERAVDKAFDPMVNFFGTGTVAAGANQRPYDFSGATACDGADRLMPFWDSFGAGPACRPLVTGEQSADENDIDLSADPRTGSDFDGTEVENTRVHLELDWLVGGMKVTYLGAYTDNETDIQEDFDLSNDPLLSLVTGGPFDFSQFGFSAMSQQTHELEQWSHELRISGETERLQWMVSGLRWEEELDTAFADEWWLREGGDADWLIDNVLGFAGITSVATGPGNTPATPISRETTHWSAALSVTWAITDAVNLTVEGRYVDEEIEYEGRGEDRSFYSAFGFGPGPMTYNSVSESEVVPRISLDWHASDDVMLYASYAEGFKPGGVATGDGNGDVSTGQFKPETLETWELGLKSDWLDGRLRFNAAAFYNEYTDQQVPFFFTDPLTGLLNTTVINAGETEVQGFEIETVWRPVDALTLSLGYIYTDAEYTDFNSRAILAEVGGEPNALTLAQAGNENGDFSGNKLIGTPENALVASGRYDVRFDNGLGAFVELLANYQDERFLDQGNNLHVPDRTIWDLYAGVSGERWEVMVYTLNLGDEDENARSHLVGGNDLRAAGALVFLGATGGWGLRGLVDRHRHGAGRG